MLLPTYYLYVLGGTSVVLAILGLALGQKRKGVRYAGLGLGGIVALVSIYLFVATGRAIVISGSRPNIAVAHVAVYGTPKVTNIAALTTDPSQTKLWVINQTSDVVLEIRTAYYSKDGRDPTAGFGSDPEAVTIPPDTAQAIESEIDQIGPEDEFPKTIDSRQDFDGRTWLTW
ncbi:MAG: hypothetical protein ACM31C_10815 [Acidobacteriota bacterium]